MLALPDLYDVDLPGVAIAADQRRIPVSTSTAFGSHTPGRIQYTDPDTRDFVWIINFIQWVEFEFDGNWVLCSDLFRWHTVLRLIWDGYAWRGTSKCEVERGHVPLGTQPPSFTTPHR